MKNKKAIFQILSKKIGFMPKVLAYYDENKNSEIDIYIGEDRPDYGISTYSTIGLSEYTIDLIDKKEREIRVEFIGICNSNIQEFPNIIASCAFRIINEKYSCRPGIVYPDIIQEYIENIDMKHIYFSTPYLWEELQGIEMNQNVINWLLAIPISDAEFKYLKDKGYEALENLLEKNSIDIFDIYRNSIL